MTDPDPRIAATARPLDSTPGTVDVNAEEERFALELVERHFGKVPQVWPPEGTTFAGWGQHRTIRRTWDAPAAPA